MDLIGKLLFIIFILVVLFAFGWVYYEDVGFTPILICFTSGAVAGATLFRKNS